MIKKTKDDFGPSNGLLKALNKFFYFVSYPLRKPLGFVLLLLVATAALYAYPVYKGVDYKNVHTWYIEKAEKTKVAELINTYNQAPQKGIDTLVETSTAPQEVRRKMFAKAVSKDPVGRDVLSEQAGDVVAVESMYVPQEVDVAPKKNVQQSDDNLIAVEVKNDQKVFKMRNGIALNYLQTPIEVVGSARVFNANELLVGDKYVFLHGVYSNPLNSRGVKAAVFLKSLIRGKTVTCLIIAYSSDEVATAECSVGGVSINDTMVENGYSDKISLQ